MKQLKLVNNLLILILNSLLIISCSTTYVEMKDRTNNTFKVRSKIAKLVDSIAKDYSLTNHTILSLGQQKPSNQYFVYQDLVEDAKIDELVLLTNHISPLVRCCAFDALIERKYSNIDSIYFSHYKDNTIFQGEGGCEYYTSNVFQHFTGRLESNNNIKNAYISLAKHKDTSDISILISYLSKTASNDEKTAIKIVNNFPHPKFLPYLNIIFEKYIKYENYDNPRIFTYWYELFQAYAQFPNSHETNDVFNKSIVKINNWKNTNATININNAFYLSKDLMKALLKYPYNNFNNIKSQIILDSETLEKINGELESEMESNK